MENAADVAMTLTTEVNGSSNHTTKFRGLEGAAYIMTCLLKHNRKRDIIEDFGGDEQLVSMWINFLIHNRWIKKEGYLWTSTNKGELWLSRIQARM